MQERINKRLMISLIVLMAGVITLFLLQGNDASFDVEKDFYRKADLKSVSRVVLESPAEKVELSFDGSRWRVNNAFNADRNLMEVLFATLAQAEPKRPVAESIRDSVATAVKTNGVKVSLFSGDQVEDSFFAGGNPQKTQAWFVKEDEDPHVMTIPGYRVYVSGIFEVPALEWRDKMIFGFNARNFKSLQASFRNPEGNFEVVLDHNQVVLKGVAVADTARLNSFMDDLALFTVAGYTNPTEKLDSLATTEPLGHFLVQDIANRSYSLKVYVLEKELMGLVNDNQWANLEERRILPLLRPKEFFVKR